MTPDQTPPVDPPQLPAQQPPPQYILVKGPPTDPSSVAALVFGILSAAGGWCCFGLPGFVALILGGVGYIQTQDGERGGRGMAIAGIVLGALTGIPWLIFGIAGIGGGIADSFQK